MGKFWGVVASAVVCVASTGFAAKGAGTIHPIGDENLGSILVTEPSWSTAEERNAFNYTMDFAGPLKATVSKRLKAGEYHWSLSGEAFQQPFVLKSNIVAGTTQRRTLAGLVVSYDRRTNNALQVDVGPTANLHVFYENQGINKVGHPAWNGDNKRGIMVLPGKYTFNWGVAVLDNITQPLKEGEVARLDITPADKRATVLIKQPARDYGSPAVTRCDVVNQIQLVHRSNLDKIFDVHDPAFGPQKGFSSSTPVDSGANQEKKVFPFPENDRSNHYSLVVNNQYIALKTEPGKTTEVQLARIDVDDVRVKRETGEEVYVAGTYSVARRTESGDWQPMQFKSTSDVSCYRHTVKPLTFPTKSGIDVVPAVYRVTITYNTAEGTKTQQHELDLR